MKWWVSMSLPIEPGWSFVTTQPVQYSGSKSLWLLRVDHKKSMHVCLVLFGQLYSKSSHQTVKKPKKPHGEDTCRDWQVRSPLTAKSSWQTHERSESPDDYNPPVEPPGAGGSCPSYIFMSKINDCSPPETLNFEVVHDSIINNEYDGHFVFQYLVIWCLSHTVAGCTGSFQKGSPHSLDSHMCLRREIEMLNTYSPFFPPHCGKKVLPHLSLPLAMSQWDGWKWWCASSELRL